MPRFLPLRMCTLQIFLESEARKKVSPPCSRKIDRKLNPPKIPPCSIPSPREGEKGAEGKNKKKGAYKYLSFPQVSFTLFPSGVEGEEEKFLLLSFSIGGGRRGRGLFFLFPPVSEMRKKGIKYCGVDLRLSFRFWLRRN